MSDSSPVGIVIACVAGVLFIALLAGFSYQYVKGKRGMQALPGYTFVATKANPKDEFSYSAIE